MNKEKGVRRVSAIDDDDNDEVERKFIYNIMSSQAGIRERVTYPPHSTHTTLDTQKKHFICKFIFHSFIHEFFFTLKNDKLYG